MGNIPTRRSRAAKQRAFLYHGLGVLDPRPGESFFNSGRVRYGEPGKRRSVYITLNDRHCPACNQIVYGLSIKTMKDNDGNVYIPHKRLLSCGCLVTTQSWYAQPIIKSDSKPAAVEYDNGNDTACATVDPLRFGTRST